MGKHANKLVLEEACKRLVSSDGTRRAVSYTAVKNMMAVVRKEAATRPHGFDQPAPATPAHPLRTPAAATRDTSGAYLGGAAQFSMDNLTKKGTTKP